MATSSVAEEAATLHRQASVVDSHNDSIVLHIRQGRRSMTGQPDEALAGRHGTVWHLRGPLDGAQREFEPQVNFPKMRAGGMDAGFFAVDVTTAWHNHLAYALDAHGFFAADLAAHPEQAVVARTAADVRAAKQQGKLACVLAIENSDALDGSINVLRMFHRLGIRAISLTHNPRAIAADGVGETHTGGGLTQFGVRLVQEMNELGVLIDVSHISERGFWEVVELTRQPVIASHSCCRALCDHVRNLTDEQLRAIRDNNGYVGITFVPSFVHKEQPSVEHLLDHFEHALAVMGPDHVGLGSDFDGGGTVLKDATELPLITDGLLLRGQPPDVVRQVLGENLLRILQHTTL